MFISHRFSLFIFLIFTGLTVFSQNHKIYLIRSSENSYVMEVDNKRQHIDGVKVYLKRPNGKDTQKWIFTEMQNGTYLIENLSAGKAMSILSYNQSHEGNQLILNTPDYSLLQNWRVIKTSGGKVKISNVKNNQVLSPKNNRYKHEAKIVLTKPKTGKRQTWVLVPVEADSNNPSDFTGRFKNDLSGVEMEVIATGNNRYKAFFTGSCTDETLTGRVGSNGRLVLPMVSNNNARLELSRLGRKYMVKITNFGVLSKSSRACNGGMIQGSYTKQYFAQPDMAFSGFYQMNYGNQQLEIRGDNNRGYRAVFSGRCNAETLPGKINRNGELEIPMRGGYNDKLYIRKNGNTLNVRITNPSLMKKVCTGGSLEGNYTLRNNPVQDFAGRYKLWSGRQYMDIIRESGERYRVVFSGNCKAETLSGTVDSRGVLRIPLRGGYNDWLEVSRTGNQFRVSITNRDIMRNACGNFNIEGLYEKQLGNSGGTLPHANFSGVYRYKMQYIQLIPEGRNRYKAHFFGDCILNTQTGSVNSFGELEIPFTDGNRRQFMRIKKIQNGIEIRNSSSGPIMSRCNGKTLEGRYTVR